jgi:gamma-glutamylputrescine oxidase
MRDGVIADLAADGRPPTLYAATAPALPASPPLSETARVDVAVIGGGFAGLSAALHLARHGRQVALLEALRIGAGASGRNGGQVHSGQRRDQSWLEARVGRDDARRLWDFGEAAKALVRELAALDPDGCFLARGIIGAAHTESLFAEFRHDNERLRTRYGYEEEDLLGRDALAAAIGSDRFCGGIRDRGAFHLDPYRLVRAIARAAAEAGARLHEDTRATAIARRDGRWRIETAAGPALEADSVIVAANGYLGRLEPRIAAHVLPLNNYIAATAPLPQEVFARLIPGGEAVYDTRRVIRYWRPTHDRRIAFGGGESTGSRVPADIAAAVRPYLEEIYPVMRTVAIEHAWGGTLAITPTRAPFIRRLEPGLYAACGFSGQGVGTAPFAGKVLADAIAGDTDGLDVFSRLPVPRFPGGTRMRAPLLALALTWYGLRDRLGV